jgi:hypothetical protein
VSKLAPQFLVLAGATCSEVNSVLLLFTKVTLRLVVFCDRAIGAITSDIGMATVAIVSDFETALEIGIKLEMVD